jgi:hypothetical protein
VLETRIVSGIGLEPLSPPAVEREFAELVASGVRLRVAGAARRVPRRLLSLGYAPRYKLRLFEATFYLAELRQEPNARFFVTWVRLGPRAGDVFARFFYKDGSLIWRSASHFARSASENWIGKGDLKWVVEDGVRSLYTAEETTNLPLEIQGVLDELALAVPKPVEDERAMGRVLRRAPDRRVAPYPDFVAPRRRAMAEPANRVNRGRKIAWFTRRGDPASLRFARGYEPDFARGVVEETRSASRLYGGVIRKFRVLSANRRIQYQFCASPQHAWIVPPQALTTELSSYGVRTVDVEVDDDLCVPAMEYHYMDDWNDPPVLYSQIPRGYAGLQSDVDVARADASPWLERLPVIAQFRRALRIPRRGRLAKRGGSR